MNKNNKAVVFDANFLLHDPEDIRHPSLNSDVLGFLLNLSNDQEDYHMDSVDGANVVALCLFEDEKLAMAFLKETHETYGLPYTWSDFFEEQGLVGRRPHPICPEYIGLGEEGTDLSEDELRIYIEEFCDVSDPANMILVSSNQDLQEAALERGMSVVEDAGRKSMEELREELRAFIFKGWDREVEFVYQQ